MKIFSHIGELIGNTPMVRLNRLAADCPALVAAKLEFFNPSSSVKDRAAWAMIGQAELSGRIRPGTVIIEPSSGNTGIGLAMACSIKGYRLIITMPESMSVERRKLIRGYGAEIVLTPADIGMKGAVAKAEELAASIPDAFIPQQFRNPANPEIHRKTTAEEIWNDTDGRIDILVSGIGTGGTVTGCGEVLKQRKNELLVIGVEPAASPVLSGGTASRHKIQGIGAGFVPDILNVSIYDEIMRVSDEDAMETARQLMRIEGIACGISSGAAAWAALQVARRAEHKGKLLVFIAPDSAERYMSTELFKDDEI